MKKRRKAKTKISRSARQRKQVRRRKMAAWIYRLLLTLLVLVAGTLALTIFFRLDHVTIEGATRYDQAALEQTLGMEKGDNLFFFRKHAAEKRLEKEYPYLEKVRISRDLPNGLVIHVTEAVPAVVIEDSKRDGCYLANRSGKLLEYTEEANTEGIPRVIGVSVDNVQPGEFLPPDAEGHVRQLVYLTERLFAWGLLKDADFINVSALYDVRVGFGKRLDIRLGEIESPEDAERSKGEMSLLDKKLRFVIYILEKKLTPSDVVIVDLTDVTRASTRNTTPDQIEVSALPIVDTVRPDVDMTDKTGDSDEN